MTQSGLIESVLQDLNLLHDSKMKDTPSLGILYPDKDGVPRQYSWNYCSVIGKLNYIAQNTQPDISFAVHQCARYSANLTALHELAVKRIGRYLLATRDKGLILPTILNWICLLTPILPACGIGNILSFMSVLCTELATSLPTVVAPPTGLQSSNPR